MTPEQEWAHRRLSSSLPKRTHLIWPEKEKFVSSAGWKKGESGKTKAILSLLSKGKSYRYIAKKLKVGMYRIMECAHQVRLPTLDGFKMSITEEGLRARRSGGHREG